MSSESKEDGTNGNGGQNSPKPDAGKLDPMLESSGRAFQAARRQWGGRVAGVGLLALVGVVCGYLLTPVLSQRIPYDERSLNKFSNTVVKANRDYDIPDDETTRRKRDEAREAVLPLYDYDDTIARMAVERIRSAFALMQEGAREVEASLVPAEDPNAKPDRIEGKPEELRQRAPTHSKEEINALYMKAFEERREEWRRRLETHLDEESYKALAEVRFSRDAQREAERLMQRANDRLVAEYREPLTISAGQGIVVRKKSDSSEQTVADVSPILDQSEVRQHTERWGEVSPDMSPALRKALVALVARQVRANLRFNRDETEIRRQKAVASAKPVIIQLKKGEKIIGDGEKIEHRHVVIFNAIRSQSGGEEVTLARVGGGLFAIVLILAVYGFARGSLRRFRPTRKDALLGALSVIVMLGLVTVSVTIADAMHDRFPTIASEALYYAAPFAAGAMLIRFVLSAEAAIVFAVVFAGLAGVLVGNSLDFGVYALIGSLVAANKVARANDRAALFRAGLHAGLANAGTVLCLAMLGGKLTGWSIVVGCASGFIGGLLLMPILVMGVTPLVEAAFGYTTDIKLLELANLNHPALKELIVQAPGTYHHSIIIGSLVEAGAEAIGANPLLARVCAYYHDIGKGKNPLYFGENQRGDNKHNKLAPQMSALIIKRHVTDGMEMARHYKLAKAVADVIPQHHGTRLVGYFYHKALKEQEGKADVQPIDDSLYRYPGPKPQTREAALVMIADAVEASSRAMQDPTLGKLQALVQKTINAIFADGQLDECDLTLRDLNEIAKSFFRTLGGIYHTRPDYPPQAVQAPGRAQLAEVREERLLDNGKTKALEAKVLEARDKPADPVAEAKRAQNDR